MMNKVEQFSQFGGGEEKYWRGIILLGLNTTSYKFSLAKSILKFASEGRDIVTLEELSIPFSSYICEHLTKGDRQGTNPTNTFLKACREFNEDLINRDELNSISMVHGFRYVLDRFHNVDGGEIPARFYTIEGRGKNRRLHLTDEVEKLANSMQGRNLTLEVDARWNLVETAWNLGVHPGLIASDGEGELILIQGRNRRSVSGVREAISGYQGGECFYCREGFFLDESGRDKIDIDHFFPLSKQDIIGDWVDLDQIWNLVLSCQNCNRGEGGKRDRVPVKNLVERLIARSNDYIKSDDPLKATLKETLHNITGGTIAERRRFHLNIWAELSSYGGALWSPEDGVRGSS